MERAAESVLGDEGEALRQARAELDKVRKELEHEIAQARPGSLARLGEVGGVGQAKLDRYGEAVLSVLQKA